MINTGNFKILSRGKVTNLEHCLEQWEAISMEISKNDGGLYEDSLDNNKNYLSIQADYATIKACLSKLFILIPFVDNDTVQLLQDMGYKINTTNKAAYIESIQKADRKANNLLNKLRSLEVKLDKILADPTVNKKELSVGELISSVNVILGGSYVNEFTSLQLYHSYKIMARNKIQLANKSANG